MHSIARTIFVVMVVTCAVSSAAAASALQTAQQKEAGGSISGRVTLGDKPASGVAVLLARSDYGPTYQPLPKAITDGEGRFQLTNVPAGNYLLQTFTPALVGSSDDYRGRAGKNIN